MILDSDIVLSALSENFPIFACIKRSLIDSCNERFAFFKKRLNNDHCDNHFRELTKSIDWSIDEDSPLVDDRYEGFNYNTFTSYDCAYPLVEMRRKKLVLLEPYIDSDLQKNLLKEKYRTQSL